MNGWRGDTSIVERIKCDIYYIENWSFLLDLKILIMTVFKGIINPEEELEGIEGKPDCAVSQYVL